MADFQASREDLEAAGARVVAGSVDDAEHAGRTVQRTGVTFPVACRMDPEAFAGATGAFWEPSRGILHATGFILRPDGTVALAAYSTGPIGRFTPEEAVGMIGHWAKG